MRRKAERKGKESGIRTGRPKNWLARLALLLRGPFFFFLGKCWINQLASRTGANGFRSQRTKSVPASSSVTGLRGPIRPQKRNGNKITRHKLWINDGVAGAELTS